MIWRLSFASLFCPQWSLPHSNYRYTAHSPKNIYIIYTGILKSDKRNNSKKKSLGVSEHSYCNVENENIDFSCFIIIIAVVYLMLILNVHLYGFTYSAKSAMLWCESMTFVADHFTKLWIQMMCNVSLYACMCNLHTDG